MSKLSKTRGLNWPQLGVNQPGIGDELWLTGKIGPRSGWTKRPGGTSFHFGKGELLVPQWANVREVGYSGLGHHKYQATKATTEIVSFSSQNSNFNSVHIRLQPQSLAMNPFRIFFHHIFFRESPRFFRESPSQKWLWLKLINPQ